MIKFEMHVHTKGGSECGKADTKTIIQDFKGAGYGGIVVTNHLAYKNYVDSLIGKTHKDKIDYFFSLYEKLKEEGNKFDIKVFYGAEIRDCNGTEFMIYGFKPEFLYENSSLFMLDQKQLFQLAEKNGLFMYQTHPFRSGVKCGNPKYLHGAEIFNGHFHHENNNELAKDFVNRNNLIKMVGTDYHWPKQPLTSHMMIPKNVNNEFELTEYLLSGKARYYVDEEYYIQEYKKYKGINNAN